MTIDEDARFDAAVENLRESADRAREQWVLAAQAYNVFRARPDWVKHKLVVELAVYLTSIDYEMKVLLHRFHTDVENRAVWERFLALEIHEATVAVPKRLGAMMRGRPAPSAEFLRYKEANSVFSTAVKQVQDDKDTWSLIKRMRNEVTAHHGSNGDEPLLVHVAWALSSEENRVRGVRSHRSQIAEFAVTIASAVQEVGARIAAG